MKMHGELSNVKRLYVELTEDDIITAIKNYIAGKHPLINNSFNTSVEIEVNEHGYPQCGTIEAYCTPLQQEAGDE